MRLSAHLRPAPCPALARERGGAASGDPASNPSKPLDAWTGPRYSYRMTTTQITAGDTIKVQHPTGIRETGTVLAVRDMGYGMVQVDMVWADGTRSWVRPTDIVEAA